MSIPKRNSVFVALQGTIGKELVFRHYTSKVVVAIYPDTNKTENRKPKRTKKQQ